LVRSSGSVITNRLCYPEQSGKIWWNSTATFQRSDEILDPSMRQLNDDLPDIDFAFSSHDLINHKFKASFHSLIFGLASILIGPIRRSSARWRLSASSVSGASLSTTGNCSTIPRVMESVQSLPQRIQSHQPKIVLDRWRKVSNASCRLANAIRACDDNARPD
jgi:hypothetical protein